MHKRNFLVVEDDLAFSTCLLRLLSRYGNATRVGTVQEAMVALARHSDWSALIVDLLLPDGSGLDVLAKFRSVHPTAPAMILTGHAEPAAINRAYDLGADYVVKPLDAQRMHQFLRPKSFGSDSLSEREREVLWHLSLGHETKVIACDLGLADSTVRVLLVRIATKLGTRSHAELLEKAAMLDVPAPAGGVPTRNR
jgi:DNA-binding NarL/FixJ family response regulator